MNTRLRAREGEYDMIHMIQNAKDQAARLTLAAYAAAAAAGELPQADDHHGPRGDPQGHRQRRLYRRPSAIAAAPALHKTPRQDRADPDGPPCSSRVPISRPSRWPGPGFLNFRLGDKLVSATRSPAVEREGADYGSADCSPRPEDHGGVRLRQPHRPHAHGQRPRRRAGRHAWPASSSCGGTMSAASSTSTTRATRSRSLPRSIEARYLQHHPGRGRGRLPRGRLPRRRHPRAGAAPSIEQHGEQLPRHAPRRSATTTLARFGLDRNIPKMKSDLAPLRHPLRPVVLRVQPARERLCGRDRRRS